MGGLDLEAFKGVDLTVLQNTLKDQKILIFDGLNSEIENEKGKFQFDKSIGSCSQP